MSDSRSQCDRLLALLTSYGEFGCPLPEILNLRIASFTRRMSDLRKLGWRIDCEKTCVDGIYHSRYTLRGPISG